ncbi:MAG: hypothetical protein MJ180_05380 [Candidatus Gastranaerophilales bacterium]|nr:hypothetical protein [Candidatus Gastranaerophilales bacterium]
MTSAVGLKTDNTDYNALLLKRRLANADELEKDESTKSQPERMIFAKKAEFAPNLHKATAQVKTIQEHTGAVAGSLSNTPLFDQSNKTRTNFDANQMLFSYKSSVESSKLTEPAGSNHSGDKHHDGNQFTSAHKKIEDLRYEKLMEGDILGNILELA